MALPAGGSRETAPRSLGGQDTEQQNQAERTRGAGHLDLGRMGRQMVQTGHGLLVGRLVAERLALCWGLLSRLPSGTYTLQGPPSLGLHTGSCQSPPTCPSGLHLQHHCRVAPSGSDSGRACHPPRIVHGNWPVSSGKCRMGEGHRHGPGTVRCPRAVALRATDWGWHRRAKEL